MKYFAIFLSVAAVATAGPIAQEDSVLHQIAENFVDCVNSDISLCFKERALKAADRLATVRKLNIIEGVTIYNNAPKEVSSLETLASEPDRKSRQLNELLWKRSIEILKDSDLELSFNGGDDAEEESRSLDDGAEGRGKKKKQLKKKLKILIPLAIMAKVKAVVLVIGALLVIAASVFKLAVLAKIAFIAKVIAIVKALIAKKHAQEEHTWVTAHEEHPPAHGGWDGGWSRSRNEAANSLAYSAHQQ